MTFSEEVKQKKKSMKLSKIILYTVFVVVILYGINFFLSHNKQEIIVEGISHVVEKGNMELYVSGEGKVISGKKIELNFPVSGTISGIYKNEGEEVLSGEKIAKLDDSIYKLELDKANINLKNSYARINEKKETLSDTEIGVAQKQLDVARENYEKTKVELATQIDDEKNNLSSLQVKKQKLEKTINLEKSNLELLKLDFDKKIENLKETLTFKSNTLILDISKYLNKIDELFGITPINEAQNDDFEDYLGTKNSALKSKFINDFKTLNNNYLSNKSLLVNDNELLDSYSKSLKNLLEDAIVVIGNSIESTSLTYSDIQNYKNDYHDYLSDLELSNQAFLLAKSNMDYEIVNKDISTKKQENLIEGLKGDLALLISDIKTYSYKVTNLEKVNYQSLQIAKKELEKSESVYKNSISGPTNAQLQPYYIDIEQSKSNVAEAEKNLSDTLLLSPVDGTILDINYKEGEYYGNKQDAFGVVISSNGAYIESYIEERDIANIIKGQSVIISLDAFDNYTFTGVVNFVSSLGEEDDDEVTKYKVLINYNETQDRIKDNMSVTLDFLVEKLNDIVVIPNDYIIYKNGIPNVLMKTGTYRQVKEGESDGENIQIVDGLNVGDEIILENK